VGKLNPSSDPKYFIAIVPPSPIYEEVNELKHYFNERYQTKGALKSPPHITLHMPFLWKEKNEGHLIQKLTQFSQSHTSFPLELKGFGSFVPRVIFVQIVPNKALFALHSALTKFCKTELRLYNSMYKDQPFHPHLTVAFRDLKKALFNIAWKEFESRSFERSFSCEWISLLKHDSRRWNVIKQFSLSNEHDISKLV
jgi:2'-5' RNA ligase